MDDAQPLDPDVARWLPNLFVIGAPKAGTTSLHAYLAEHPEASMTSVKEPMCFARHNWREQVRRYPDLFGGLDAPVRGESSTAYSSYPWSPRTPELIAAHVPEARLVYLVRDPVSRTLSHYAQNLWDGKPIAAFEDLLSRPDDVWNMPIWCSRYATQIARWLEHFRREQLLVVDQRDLLADRAGTLRTVFAFLGIDEGFSTPAWEAEHNTAEQHRVPNRLGRRIRALRQGPLARFGTREIPKPEVTSEQRRRLEELFADEAGRLREITGLTFSHWSV